ncbi:MAG TPA: potassium transporter TrkG [Thermomicrobiales bacterium]|nr:potassium transporter TrkG [Thermomicrobiales bacterium]
MRNARRRAPFRFALPESSSADRSPPNARIHALRFTLALLATIALGTGLLLLPWSANPGRTTAPVDALFTAVSAAAVTGLVVVDTADHWSRFGQAVILALMQIGGLGFAVGASLLLQMLRRGPNASLRDQLLMRDGAPALSLREAILLSGRIVRYTLVVEGIGALLLTWRFASEMPLPEAAWRGLFHAVAAFCNAGFDLQGRFLSIIPYQTSVSVNLVLMALIQAGALGYVVASDVWRCRQWRSLPLDTKLVLGVNALLLVAAAVTFLAVEWTNSLAAVPTTARPLAALFQSVAARTAGFASVNWGEADAVTLFVWVGVMMVGGASGSTAGGVKLTTIGVIAAAIAAAVAGRSEAQLFGRRLATALVYRSLAIVAIFGAFHFAASALLAITEDLVGGRGTPFIALMFEAMSALATVGLSTGITPGLTTAGKIVLCLAMFAGRLGPLTIAYALQRHQRPARYRFPEEPVRIG